MYKLTLVKQFDTMSELSRWYKDNVHAGRDITGYIESHKLGREWQTMKIKWMGETRWDNVSLSRKQKDERANERSKFYGV